MMEVIIGMITVGLIVGLINYLKYAHFVVGQPPSQGLWECEYCGYVNLDEDPFCIICMQDREISDT